MEKSNFRPVEKTRKNLIKNIFVRGKFKCPFFGAYKFVLGGRKTIFWSFSFEPKSIKNFYAKKTTTKDFPLLLHIITRKKLWKHNFLSLSNQ